MIRNYLIAVLKADIVTQREREFLAPDEAVLPVLPLGPCE
jgi:hypothetical protein